MQPTATTDPLAFLSGQSEMARLIRQKDWLGTPLGPPDTWPQPLRTLVSTCLNSRFPMVIWWGPGLVMLYNDAYKLILGDKHPHALGTQGDEVWPEIWNVVGPMLNGVLTRGEATWSENQRLLINRHGYEEESYFTFSYSPIHDESGGIGGVFCAVTETTAIVLAERQMRALNRAREENEQQLRSLFEQAPVAISVLRGPEFVVELTNPLMCEIWNRRADQLLGRPVFEVLTESAGQGFEELLTGVLETGIPFEGRELPVIFLRNGELQTVFVNFVYEPLRDAGSDRISGIVAVATEVTESVRTRQRVEASEQLLNAMIRQTPLGVAVFRGANNIIELANPTICQFWGRPLDQTLNKPFFEAAPEIKGQGFEELLAGVRLTGQPFIGKELPATLLRNGQLETVYFDFVYEPLHEADGRIERVMVVATDVTQSREARLGIENRNAQLQTLFRQAPVAIAIFRGRNLLVELANERHLQFWNRTLAEVVGRPVFEVIPEAAGQGYEAILLKVLETGVPYVANEQYVELTRNGNREGIWVNVAYEPLREGEAGHVTGIMEVIYEVTEQVQARQLIQTSEQRFHTMANSIDQLAWIAHADGWIYWYNERWYAYTGTTLEQMHGWGWQTVHHPDHIERVTDFVREAWGRGEPFELTFPLRSQAGSYRWFLTRAYPIKDETGKVIQWVGTNTDIDEQKNMADQLEQLVAERTESLRQTNTDLERSNLDLMQFASVASHDLKEPLRKIQTFGTRLEEMLAGRLSTEETDLFRRMIASTARMQMLVGDVLRLSKLADQTTSFEPVNLNAVISQIRDDLDLTIQERGAYLQSVNLPTVMASPGQMYQLFLNLISNALKFNNGAVPAVRVDSVSLTDELVGELALPTRNYVVIVVSDNGIGFDPKYKDKIFGMFQRLHGRSQYAGTGIGLTIVKKIVENHRGYINVQSEPDTGTTFRISLPVM